MISMWLSISLIKSFRDDDSSGLASMAVDVVAASEAFSTSLPSQFSFKRSSVDSSVDISTILSLGCSSSFFSLVVELALFGSCASNLLFFGGDSSKN